MARAGAIVFTAALLLGTLSGCTMDATSLNVFAASNEREWVMSGSLDSVAAATQKSLLDLNVSATLTKEGDAVRIASCTNTKESKRFSLVLNRVKGVNGEQTRVQIVWGEDGADNLFWFKLLETVGTAKAQGENDEREVTATPRKRRE